MRPTWCEVDLRAIAHNVSVIAALVPNSDLCAVVKADAYGHGAVPVARTAIEAGVDWLAVALVEEGVELRGAGIDAPILLLSEPHESDMDAVVEHRLTPSLYTRGGIDAAAAAARSAGSRLAIELCVDTGMRRVGAEPEDVNEIIATISEHNELELTGVWSHCAVADEPGNPFTHVQTERFGAAIETVAGTSIRSHIGNSAVALAHAHLARDMIRLGISLYGVPPSPELASAADLRPSLSLRSSVSFVKSIAAGDGVSYGHRWTAPDDRRLATVPIGYADGVRRDLGLRGGEVLIGGQRRPIVGVVTMDQLMVDLGGDGEVAPGDDVVLIGRQGDEEISAAEIAERLDTIPYEVLCAIGPRVPRVHR